jgi:hypothetical protein
VGQAWGQHALFERLRQLNQPIERMIGHLFWNERVKMHQWWSDYLDQLRRGEGEGSLDNSAIAPDTATSGSKVIEGKSPACRIAAKRTRRGNPGDEEASRRRDDRISAFVSERAQEMGQFEAAVVEASDHFKLGRTAVTDALRKNGTYRDSLPPKLRIFWDQVWSSRAI